MTGPTRLKDSQLAGMTVAFTGRLASLTRSAAAELVAKFGGRFSRSVTRTTRLLVIGAAGAPFDPDGRPTRKLARAEALARQGFEIEVLTEETFLARLGLASGDILNRRSLPALAELLGLSVRQAESMVQTGFVAPIEVREGVPLFDYRSVASARSLLNLLDHGVPARTLLRSLARVKAWLPSIDAAEALARLSVSGGRVVLRDEQGRWTEPGGQLILGFDETSGTSPVVLPLSFAGEDLFLRALDREAVGDLPAAADLYRRLLREEGPDADAAFNLGNILYALGDVAAAAERFRQSAELDPGRADAWFNLGNILADSGNAEPALAAFRRAADADTSYAEARSAYADLLEQSGRGDEARPHWRVYLELEPHGPWADYALRRLAERPAS